MELLNVYNVKMDSFMTQVHVIKHVEHQALFLMDKFVLHAIQHALLADSTNIIVLHATHQPITSIFIITVV